MTPNCQCGHNLFDFVSRKHWKDYVICRILFILLTISQWDENCFNGIFNGIKQSTQIKTELKTSLVNADRSKDYAMIQQQQECFDFDKNGKCRIMETEKGMLFIVFQSQKDMVLW